MTLTVLALILGILLAIVVIFPLSTTTRLIVQIIAGVVIVIYLLRYFAWRGALGL